MHKWFVYTKFDEASTAAAEFLAEKIETCVQQKGSCHVILPGGNTPVRCLAFLAEKALPWNKVHWYLGDERCYPKDHTDRNDVMLQKNFWSLISETNIHLIQTELGAEKAAEIYQNEIKEIASFDIAFLGMGEDGHTASLFPGNKALEDKHSVVAVYNSPKAPDERVSLSMDTLRKVHCRVVLVGGEQKAAVISRIKSGEALPINSIGEINWYIDEAAISSHS